MPRRPSHRSALVLALPALACLALPLAPSSVGAQDSTSPVASRLDDLIELLEKREGEGFWSVVDRMESLGSEVAAELEDRVETGSEKARLGCAKALLNVGGVRGRRAALAALTDLSKSARDQGVRIDAIAMRARFAVDDVDELDSVIESYQSMLEDELDAMVVISLARALFELDGVEAARNRLVELLESKDVTIRQEAALTLAELGSDHPVVKDVVRRLSKEPTPRGRRAELLQRVQRLERQAEARLLGDSPADASVDLQKLLEIKETRIEELQTQLEKVETTGRPATPADELLDEVVRTVQRSYVDESKVTREKLLLSAAKGMVRALDAHSLLMEVEQARDFDEDISGKYAGIGAQISKPSGTPLEILRPIYGGPADKAGLLSGDLILEIDGRPTSEMKLDELRDALRGEVGQTVTLRILRRTWPRPRDVPVRRDFVKLPSVHYEVLPEGIGYVRLDQFGKDSYEDFVSALEELEAKGLQGLVFDLRDNPGGLLIAAERIADLFVRGDLPIVTRKGRGDADGRSEQSTYPTAQARVGYPIVVLVNGGSASAAEVVSGCLQDYGRATIVGERTFGKGSVQNLIPLRSRPGATLKLTVQYWHLPLDRCIDTIRDETGRVVQEGGIAPDIHVVAEQIPAWRLEERSTLRNDSRIVEYVDQHFESLRSLVPLGDHAQADGYPALEGLVQKLDTRATEEDVRFVIRYHVRRRLEDSRHREFPFDLAEDVQLQQAIAHLLDALERDRSASTTYSWIRVQEPGSEGETHERGAPAQR